MALSRKYKKQPEDEDSPSALYIPTPEEIEEAAGKIRESWEEEEEQKRAGTNGVVPAVGMHECSGELRNINARKFITRTTD